VWFENAYSRPKNGGFREFDPLNGEQYQQIPKKAHPYASPHRLSHQAQKSAHQSEL